MLFAAGAATALDPAKAITQYAHQVWKTDQGLPQNSIQAILQTRDGYLWLGTERGLVRFDGVHSPSSTRATRRGCATATSRRSTRTTRERLWVGTWGGLHRFQDGKFTAYTTREGLTTTAF